MEMENMLQMIKQMITRLEEAEAKAEARQEKADADAKARQEKADADAKARQERADACQEKANAEMKASQERANAEMKAVQIEIKAAYAEMEARAEVRHERFLARLDGIDISRKRNDDLSDRDDVMFRRNWGYEFGGESRRNRGRSGAAGALKGRDKR
jgi:hypothetical protein